VKSSPPEKPTRPDLHEVARELADADQRLEHFSPREIAARLDVWLDRLAICGPEPKRKAGR
jgi:hypothetical protein